MRTLRRALAALLVLAALTAFFYWQNCSIQTEQVEVALSALPPQFDGLRVAEIADLHGRQFGTDNAALLRAVKNAAAKLDAARRYLSETELSVGEIAARLGYCDQSYFSASFRKTFGAYPTKWRSENRI